MLNVDGLTKKYGKVLACDNVSFSIPDGSITILLGPNGAGKSTVIKSVAGFLRYRGLITVGGFDNKSLEAKRILGYIPEMPALYPNLTVMEHMEFVARAYRLKDYKGYADQLLGRMELSDKKKKFGDELSKGMQQKLSICCGLLTKPRLIMFDEPMIGLDPHAIKELKNIFTELRDDGCALLISTHIIDSVDAIWDRTLIMKDGNVLANVTRDGLSMAGQDLESLFFSLTESEGSDLNPTASVTPSDVKKSGYTETGVSDTISGQESFNHGNPDSASSQAGSDSDISDWEDRG